MDQQPTDDPTAARALPYWRAIAGCAVVMSAGLPVAACPLCDTGTGEQVRAGILDGNFGQTAVAVLLPFPILLGVVAMIHFGWPPWSRAADRHASTGDLGEGTDDDGDD